MSGVEASTRSHRPRWLIVAAIISALTMFGCPADPGYGGRTSADWIRQLSDPDEVPRQRAALALGEVLELQPKSPRVVAALVRALRDTVDGVRETAGVALNAPGVRVDGAMPVLVELVADSAHSHTREHGAMIIGAFGSHAAPAVPALVRALDDPVPEVRAAAAEAIGRVGPTAAAAASALGRHVSDPSSAVRLKVVEATLNIRAPNDVALHVLTMALRDEVPAVRAAAGYAVGGMMLSDGRPDTARVGAFLWRCRVYSSHSRTRSRPCARQPPLRSGSSDRALRPLCPPHYAGQPAIPFRSCELRLKRRVRPWRAGRSRSRRTRTEIPSGASWVHREGDALILRYPSSGSPDVQ